jgi:tetratricopeptide (TPR) repeat protein
MANTKTTEKDPMTAESEPSLVDAVVLKVNEQSARVRILAETESLTFKSRDVWNVFPGQRVTLALQKRWTWNGDPYASGHIHDARIAVDEIGLTPLPLSGGDPMDLRSGYEPYRRPDPYAPLWRAFTATPRRDFIMDPIAWGQLPGVDDGDNPTCDAADLAERGDYTGAYELLMQVLTRDLRVLDAHAHLGNLEFDASPKRALVHYEIGMRIGALSVPEGFDGVLLWGHVTNRPFLRCLHGYGLCQWRQGLLAQAQQTFERILSLNPPDNQGARFCWDDVRRGRSWEEAQE